MNPYMAYEAVNTKIMTRIGQVLNTEKLNKILDFSTVDQLIDYIKDQDIVKRMPQNHKIDNINRDSLESLLGIFKTNEIEDMIHYFSGPYKDFIKSMLIDSEIADITLILRKIARGESLSDINKRFVHSEKYTSIEFDKLIGSKSIENFTQNLKDTPYYIGLRNLSNDDAINREFHIEMKLQGVFYKTLLSKAEKLNKEDMETAKDIIGHKIDLENIQWIYRALRYYDISPEEILIYSLEGGKKIGYSRLKSLCYVKSSEEFKQLVTEYLKYNIFEGIAESDTDIGIDYNMYKYLKNKHYKNIGSCISYVIILGIIIDDLSAITEGIKYNMPREKLMEYLAYRNLTN